MDDIISQLKEASFNRHIEVEERLWKECRQNMHLTNFSLAEFLNKDKPSYRDDRKRGSVHLKDYRNYGGSEKDFVAELERFNPEYHPLLHLCIDFPLWVWRNRIT